MGPSDVSVELGRYSTMCDASMAVCVMGTDPTSNSLVQHSLLPGHSWTNHSIFEKLVTSLF